jgi:hypothetical protein
MYFLLDCCCCCCCCFNILLEIFVRSCFSETECCNILKQKDFDTFFSCCPPKYITSGFFLGGHRIILIITAISNALINPFFPRTHILFIFCLCGLRNIRPEVNFTNILRLNFSTGKFEVVFYVLNCKV